MFDVAKIMIKAASTQRKSPKTQKDFPYKNRGIPSAAVSMLTLHGRIIPLNYTKRTAFFCAILV
jgi:hypothetical protein